ncbi:unnamed protein product [Oikopleura dioica]|uniref:Uncharacterized protein n=1 Tax=Oikopleura dioica TaxID=34765 RepID=E4YI10_OIKDI|nr:unnamed protein product [Oikopleura dioica]
MEFFLDTFWREKVRFFRQVSFCECAGSNYSFRDKLRGSSARAVTCQPKCISAAKPTCKVQTEKYHFFIYFLNLYISLI